MLLICVYSLMAISVKQLVSAAAFFLPFLCWCLEWFTGTLPPCCHFENVSVPTRACFWGWPLPPVPSRRGSVGWVWPQKRPALLLLPQADSMAMAHAFSSINQGHSFLAKHLRLTGCFLSSPCCKSPPARGAWWDIFPKSPLCTFPALFLPSCNLPPWKDYPLCGEQQGAEPYVVRLRWGKAPLGSSGISERVATVATQDGRTALQKVRAEMSGLLRTTQHALD